ncbi:MAG: exopolysaccharide biosynthesis polyprenyl glycosylphosphotransferase [Undibacterium sp.]|nr:exopolysaccharide biosynthesis polyprenyl glycosylphosphotransferase [Opitutaceae bacterium]
MLKNRQDGLIGLHGTVLLILVAAAFIGSLLLVETRGWIRFNLEVNWGLYLIGVFVAMAWIHYSLRGAGDRLGALNWREAIRLTAQQLVRLMVVLFTLAFIMKDVEVSRAFLVGFLFVAAVLLFSANFFLARLLSVVFFRRQRLRTVIVSSRAEARLLQAWLAPRGHLGIDAIGFVTPDADNDAGDAMRLGGQADLIAIITRHAADQVVFSQAEFSREGVAGIVSAVERAHCRVRFFVNMQSVFGGNPEMIEHNEHYAFAASTREPLENPLNRVLKRTLDIVVALPVVLLVLPPLTLAVWFMQRRQSPGPTFYRQLRSGLNRERFYIYKFRTMHLGDARLCGKQAAVNDARVYPFGRFLRRSSLDEIPQFLNVIMGAMSVSGPRPHLLEHDEQFARLEHAYFKRHFVKPGITGLAQSKGFRGELLASSDLANRVRYDELYVTNWSLGLDVSILLNTVRQVVAPPRSAY